MTSIVGGHRDAMARLIFALASEKADELLSVFGEGTRLMREVQG
jgi:hypothetical protein